MPRLVDKLTKPKIDAVIKAGGVPHPTDPTRTITKIGLGRGLCLWVRASGGYWTWSYRDAAAGYVKTLGLGPVADLPTQAHAEARRDEWRAKRKAGDAMPSRSRGQASGTRPAAGGETFGEAAAIHLAGQGMKAADRKQSWMDTKLAMLADIPFAAITARHIADCLMQIIETKDGPRPLWQGPNVNPGNGIRCFIEAVLESAAARAADAGQAQFADFRNPALWRTLQHFGLAKERSSEAEKLGSLPFKLLPELWAKLAADDSARSRALRFGILTGSRHEESLSATWSEFDLDAKLWTVAGERMKNGKPHAVPLSGAAVALLGEPGAPDARVFNQNHLLPFLQSFGYSDPKYKKPITIHGFRRCFKNWAATNAIPDQISEAALAHADKDKVRKAYLDDEALLPQIRDALEKWAQFATTR